MKKVTFVARLLFGLIFLASGVAYFFTTPPPLEGAMGDFFNGLLASGYFIYLLKGTEIVCGLFLLLGVFVPLALVVLAPIVLNIFLLSAFLAPESLPIAIGLGVFEVYLAFFSSEYSPSIKALFQISGNK